MIYAFFILFGLIILELTVIIKVGAELGAINTLILLFGIGFLGAWLAKLQGFLLLQKIQRQLDAGQMPTEDMLHGILLLIGGVLLILPGFITDVIGLLFVLPIFRELIKILLRRQFQDMVKNRRSFIFRQFPSSGSGKYNDIDV